MGITNGISQWKYGCLNPNIFIVIEKGSEKHDFSERFVYSLTLSKMESMWSF